MKLTDIKKRLKEIAIAAHGEDIVLTAGHTDIDECIMFYQGAFYFWYNTGHDDSTHLAKLDLTVPMVESYIPTKQSHLLKGGKYEPC